jgi:hypothetical protein
LTELSKHQSCRTHFSTLSLSPTTRFLSLLESAPCPHMVAVVSDDITLKSLPTFLVNTHSCDFGFLLLTIPPSLPLYAGPYTDGLEVQTLPGAPSVAPTPVAGLPSSSNLPISWDEANTEYAYFASRDFFFFTSTFIHIPLGDSCTCLYTRMVRV